MNGIEKFHLDLITRKEFKCNYCQSHLGFNDIEHYDHTDGVSIEGYQEPQWVSYRCQKKTVFGLLKSHTQISLLLN